MCCRRKSSKMEYYDSSYVCIGMLVCLCLLSIIASPFVLMHGANAWTSALHPGFHRMQCSLTNVNVTSQTMNCTCNKDYDGKYPCIIMSVKVDEEKKDSHEMEKQNAHHTVMYHTIAELQDKKCSFKPKCDSFQYCENVTEDASKEVMSYIAEIRSKDGVPFDCFLNSETGEVVREISPKVTVHQVLWAIVMSIVILIDLSTCIVCTCKCSVKRRKQPALPQNDPLENSDFSRECTVYDMSHQSPNPVHAIRKFSVI